jgi:hypothetical protein
MRPIRSMLMFAAGATAATPRGRALTKKAFAAARKARQRQPVWHDVPPPGDGDERAPRPR